MTNEAEKIAAEIDAMSPGDQARLAAALLDERTPKSLGIAVSILRKVTAEADAVLMMHEMKSRKAAPHG